MAEQTQELSINRNASAEQMAEEIFSDGTVITAARYFGDRNSSGTYSGGDTTANAVTPSDSGVILSTGRVQNFTNGSGDPNTSPSTSTNTNGVNNDPLLNAIAGNNTFDAAILEVDFIADTEFLSMQFTFASEEYPEYVNSIFNDAVGIWINGQLVMSPILNVTQINTVNQSSNESLFVDNTGDDYNTEMDGFTVTLSVLIPVNIGQENTLRIAIADVADSSYDSAILIAGNSVQGDFLANDDFTSAFEGQTQIIDVLANDGVGGVSVVTHINGQAVSAGQMVALSSGHQITLLANGDLQIVPPASQTGLTAAEQVTFSYTAENQAGISDTAFVVVEAIPCFVRGTFITTPDGDVRVEDLHPGMLVNTRDCGPQPIRWIGSRSVPAQGKFAPVVIEAGTFGHHRRLSLSPQHRVLITHWTAEMMFGEEEVLVAAKDLVNDCSVRIVPGGMVEYFHILFDAHQVIWSEGLLTESFLPGPMTLGHFEDPAREELLALFPEIDPDTHLGYGTAARPMLKSYEARTLRVA